ncbi:hypothetical protein BGX28_009016 [Mortierella sp. GBA30]|nr:hypothetical protein BGX28_009016 [Mortierella sp. GBA30]
MVTLDPSIPSAQQFFIPSDLNNSGPRLSDSVKVAPIDNNRIAFYKAYDAKRSRWFFDLRFTPTDSWAGQLMTIYFASYLLMDLVCGWYHYREKMNLLTGWIHHSMYLWVCYYATRLGHAHLLACHTVMEVPTFFMGLGQVYKPFRNDFLFTTTFLLFRILYDCAITHEIVVNRPESFISIKIISLLKVALHFKFFSDLVKQQIRLRSNRKDSYIKATSLITEEVRSTTMRDISSEEKENERSIAISASLPKSMGTNMPEQEQQLPTQRSIAEYGQRQHHIHFRMRRTLVNTGDLMEDQPFVGLISVH